MIDIESITIELANILSNTDDNLGGTRTILVAGQALAFWGNYYIGDDLDLSPLSSRDIDFYTARTDRVKAYTQQVAKYLSNHNLQLRQTYPDLADNQFATALWNIEGEVADTSGGVINNLVVDFLNFISGITPEDNMANTAIKVTAGDTSFYVMNPILCLKSRVNNLLHVYPGRKPQAQIINEEKRVGIAITIVKIYIRETFYGTGKASKKEAKKQSKKIVKIAKSALGRKLYRDKGIILLDAIPTDIFDTAFYQRTIESARSTITRDKVGIDPILNSR